MYLPIQFLKFYYPESFITFSRIWHNLIMVAEEDLAVGLMLKLLFTPLFHDATFVGKVMSFFFRLFRIFTGLLAFLLITLLMIFLSLSWFLLPIILPITIFSQNFGLIVPNEFIIFLLILLLLAIALFINQIINKPLKKVWQIKDIKDIWKATKLTQKDINWQTLLKLPEVQSLIKSLELDSTNFASQQVIMSDSTLAKTLELAKLSHAVFLSPTHFWVALLEDYPNIENQLMQINLTLKDFELALKFQELKNNHWKRFFIWDEDFAVRHLKGVNRGWLGAPTPALDSVSTDLTKEASVAKSEAFIGREGVLREVITILNQDRDRNVLLIGSPGSGKTSLVKKLAEMIVLGDAPQALATKRIVSLDFTRLLSGVETEGDLATKIKAVFEEVSFLQNIIIFVDEIQNLGLGDAGKSFNLFNLIIPYLESDKFQFIGATDSGSYAKVLEKNSSLSRLFRKVEMPEASLDETYEIIEERAIELARYKKIAISYLAIKELVEKSSKLIHDKVLPDSALSILEECVSTSSDIKKAVVDQILSQRSKIPMLEIDSSQKDLLLDLENIIHQKLIDQEEAVHAVADALRRSAASLNETTRPIGSFLFTGPTGVGKTELSKVLSEVFFKTTNAFLRFDMSEYQTPEALNQLVGTTETPGELTEAVKNKPYCLLLLDEFEKASPAILTLFLQILEDGRLTDGTGKHVDFTNTIIIATSNVASVTIAEGLKNNQTIETLEQQVQTELLKIFKPELINRFDKVVIFKPLSRQDLEKIVNLKLESLKKLLKAQGFLVEFDSTLITELAKRGFDPILGARPLRRLIQDTLEARLSRLILENKLAKGQMVTLGIDLMA